MAKRKKNKSPFKKDGLFNEANPLVFELAKELRRNMTDAEIILWNCLKVGINVSNLEDNILLEFT